MDNCTVWQEGKWIGPAAPVYCTAERDLAEASTPPGLFVRYECESISSEGLAHANDR
jgi:hypothetical protein